MKLSQLIALPVVVLSLSFSLSSAQPNFTYSFCINTAGNYTNTSAFAANLNTLLTSITHIETGYYNLTAGVDSGGDRVNGFVLCRGDVGSSDCKSCASDAAKKIRVVCPTQKEAVGWYDHCMIRYSNQSLFGVMDELPEGVIYNTVNASDPDTYASRLGTLLQQLQAKAVAGDSRLKYAAGSARVSDFVYVYALVECTPDLSPLDCGHCISGAMGFIQSTCYGKIAAFVGRPSCVIQFDRYQFYTSDTDETPSSSPPPASLLSNGTKTTSAGTIGKVRKGGQLVIAVVFPTLISIVLVTLLSWCFFRRRRWIVVESSPAVCDAEDDIHSNESFQFDLRTIRAATTNFSDANQLGRGGFGAVYKGLLPNGQQIAVKRLSQNSAQGGREFKTEVSLLAKLRHRNLVMLLGFCMAREERLLIYEFVPSGSLDQLLFDPVKGGVLDWNARYKIIMGIARGLLYLHEGSQLRIIHRDLKAGNILLDAEMDPRLSDFGMASLFQADQTQGDTNRVVGTYGYMAPEYALHGLFSAKSDVYSFGVLVLEIISGRSIGTYQGENSTDLISSVWRNWREGHPMNIVDERLSTRRRSEIMRCIHIGLLCVQEEAPDRPITSSVVAMLSSHSFSLPLPSYPAYVNRSMIPLLRISETHGSQVVLSKESMGKSRI